MAIYERSSGGYTAERIRTIPDSEGATRYAALADDPGSGWRCVEPDPEPEPAVLERPAKSASRADWKAYAVQEGMDEDEADKATRDELAARYADGGGD
ncbi:hypothetical protein [Streptomyces chartreusis]|uniref:hypothetical protein n=1 Tax=Streptomyces chartreusis TaxID=1969 RepID=UPI00380CEA48